MAIIREGRLTRVDRVEALRDMAHHQVELRFIGPVPADEFARIDGVSDGDPRPRAAHAGAGDITPVVKAAARYELADFVSREPTLEETSWPSTGRTPGPMQPRRRGTLMTGTTAPLSRPSPLSRLFGLGSVFGKTLRDSRRATLLDGFAIGALLVVVAAGIISQFDTPEARDEIGNIVNAVPPIMQGLAGKPVNVETWAATSSTSTAASCRWSPACGRSWRCPPPWPARRAAAYILVAAPLSRRRSHGRRCSATS